MSIKTAIENFIPIQNGDVPIVNWDQATYFKNSDHIGRNLNIQENVYYKSETIKFDQFD